MLNGYQTVTNETMSNWSVMYNSIMNKYIDSNNTDEQHAYRNYYMQNNVKYLDLKNLQS